MLEVKSEEIEEILEDIPLDDEVIGKEKSNRNAKGK